MQQHKLSHIEFFRLGVYFEGTLALFALALAWLAGIDPLADIHFELRAVLSGLLLTLPLYLVFVVSYHHATGPFSTIREFLVNTLGSYLSRCHWGQLAFLAAMAGIGEELLFRGVLQPWMEQAWGTWAGLVISNIIFGMAHAITLLYALLAAMTGIYLGLCLDFHQERNLLIPIVVHGVYDFLAFMVVAKAYINRTSPAF